MKREMRQDMINCLVVDLIDSSRDDTFLYDLFADGFKGYNNFTDDELKQEYKDRIDS